MASAYENYGNIFGESSPDVRDTVKEKMEVICKDLNLFTTNICFITINVMTMKEIYQKTQLVCTDPISNNCKILVYIQIIVATACNIVATTHIITQH